MRPDRHPRHESAGAASKVRPPPLPGGAGFRTCRPGHRPGFAADSGGITYSAGQRNDGSSSPPHLTDVVDEVVIHTKGRDPDVRNVRSMVTRPALA